MAISGLSNYQIIRYKDLIVGDNYKYYINGTTMPDNILITSQKLYPTTATTTGTYTFIGPSTPYPDDNQCVTANMFGANPITGFTVNISITMYGNVYLSGMTNNPNLSAVTNFDYKYIIPDATTSSSINSYIAAWSGTSNTPTQYIFTISGGTPSHSPLLSYSQLNQVNLANNRFELTHLNTPFRDDSSNVYIYDVDAFKIGTIPYENPRSIEFSYSGNRVYSSIKESLYLKQRQGLVTGVTFYNTPGISIRSLNTFSKPQTMICQMPLLLAPTLPLNDGYLSGIACKQIITRDVKTVSNQHLTRNIGLTLISPIFRVDEIYL